MPKKVLAGYVKSKKRLISPLNALGIVKTYSFVDDLLPELLWLGLIHDYGGYLAGRDVLECVTTLELSWPKPDQPRNFALQSSYAALGDEQKDGLLNAWRGRAVLRLVQDAVAPLTLLYDDFALRFVGPPSVRISDIDLVNRLERVVSQVSDRNSTPGVMLHGALFLNNLLADRIRLSKDISLPDFEAVIHAPDSEEGRRAASFLRATAMAQTGFMEMDGDWAEKFWARSYALIPCRAML